MITALAGAADVLFVAGSEALAERSGLRAWDLARSNPRLVGTPYPDGPQTPRKEV